MQAISGELLASFYLFHACCPKDAMKLHAAGRPIPRADLPDPPGFAPIPVSDAPQACYSCLSCNRIWYDLQAPTSASKGAAVASATTPAASAAATHAAQVPGGAVGAEGPRAQAARSAASPPKATRQTSATMSVQEKQLAGLLKRQVFHSCVCSACITSIPFQTLFKQAALAAKQQGQTDTAKEYLK